MEPKKPITLLMPAGGIRQAPRADASFMLVEYETEYQLRFGRKIKKVPGVGMASFWVERGSEAGRFVEQGFPPASEETRALYAPLLTYYGAKLTGGGVGFSGIMLDEGVTPQVRDIMHLFVQGMCETLPKAEKRRLDAHFLDHVVSGFRFAYQPDGQGAGKCEGVVHRKRPRGCVPGVNAMPSKHRALATWHSLALISPFFIAFWAKLLFPKRTAFS